MTREGILVERPYEMVSQKEIERIHDASVKLLRDPGMICWNREAAEIFHGSGAEVTEVSPSEPPSWTLKIPEKMILQAINDAPKAIKLGARNKDNTVIVNGEESRVFFTGGSSEPILDVDFDTFTKKSDPSVEAQVPVFRRRQGPNIDDLTKAAHVSEYLETMDSFSPAPSLYDEGITLENHGVNRAFVALNNITKHVKLSGAVTVEEIPWLVKMAEIIAGGAEKLRENPILSLEEGPVLSPLQFPDDAVQRLIVSCRTGLPYWFALEPDAGLTAPIIEVGLLVQANAEGLATLTLTQLANKGVPVICGITGLFPRMDSFNPTMRPETIRNWVIESQIWRFYKLPTYMGGIGCDAEIPGIQASVEKVFSALAIILGGTQNGWYSHGLLGAPSYFCLPQVVLDDANYQMLKYFLKAMRLGDEELSESVLQIKEAMGTPNKQFMRYIRSFLRTEKITPLYPFESGELKDTALQLAYNKVQELLAKPVEHLSPDITKRIFSEIPGLLPRLNIYK